MSLDVTLYADKKCPNCDHVLESDLEVFSANITHNLGKMAEAAGIYMELWRPEEIGIDRAHQLIYPLRKGVEKMLSDPEYYKKFNSPNGWGLYDNFVPWVERYLEACRENPESFVRADR